MGYRFEVWGWTFGINPQRVGLEPDGAETWHYDELYQGQSLLRALWVGLLARRHHGCVKLKLR